MQAYPIDLQRPDFFSFLGNPLFSQERAPSTIQDVRQLSGKSRDSSQGASAVGLLKYTANDYCIGKADTLHATMVDEFLRLFCEEEPSSQPADAVVIVDIQGCIHGYGCRHDSSFVDVVMQWDGRLVTDMLSEQMRRQWLNQNIDCIALQRRHWRLFRVYDTGATHMVLMEFHPVEMQRTALVLWVLGI